MSVFWRWLNVFLILTWTRFDLINFENNTIEMSVNIISANVTWFSDMFVTYIKICFSIKNKKKNYIKKNILTLMIMKINKKCWS